LIEVVLLPINISAIYDCGVGLDSIALFLWVHLIVWR